MTKGPSPILRDALRQNLTGLDAIGIYQHVLPDKPVLAFMETILRWRYTDLFGSPGHRFVEEWFGRLHRLPCSANVETIKSTVVEMRSIFQALGLTSAYFREFRAANIDRSIGLMAGNFGGTVVDIGAEDNMLGLRLCARFPSTERVIGTDIVRRNPITEGDRLQFRLQSTGGSLPVDDQEADVCVCRYSLHHMTHPEQAAMLQDVLRVLKAGGRFLIYENTYSENLRPLAPDSLGLHKAFIDLAPADRRRLVLAAMDTFSLGIKDKAMPFPFTFRSVEEWRALFVTTGFEVKALSYYGIPPFDLHQAPLGCFVLVKP